jgi:hypothetical protein
VNRSAGVGWPGIEPPLAAIGQNLPNGKTVDELNTCPGLSTVLRKLGWLGESGKCCVSKVYPALDRRPD